MGSKEIWNLDYRQGFAFIGITGRKEFKEVRAFERKEAVTVTQVYLVRKEFKASDYTYEQEMLHYENFITEIIEGEFRWLAKNPNYTFSEEMDIKERGRMLAGIKVEVRDALYAII